MKSFMQNFIISLNRFPLIHTLQTLLHPDFYLVAISALHCTTSFNTAYSSNICIEFLSPVFKKIRSYKKNIDIIYIAVCTEQMIEKNKLMAEVKSQINV